MLPPLLELRARWRETVVIHAPELSEEIDDLLRRSLSYLETRDLLSEGSLTSVVDVVTGALPGNSDLRAILRAELMKAVHDYTAVAGTGNMEISDDATAFASEEALSAALLGMAHGDVGPEAAMESVSLSPPTVDVKSLEQALKAADRHTRTLRLLRILGLLGLVVAALAVGVLAKPFQPKPLPTPTPAIVLLSYSGTLGGAQTVCNGVASTTPNLCDVQLQLNGTGQMRMTVTWDTSEALAASILDGAGRVVASQTSSGGALELLTPTVGAGQYVLIWTASPAGKLEFTSKVTNA